MSVESACEEGLGARMSLHFLIMDGKDRQAQGAGADQAQGEPPWMR